MGIMYARSAGLVVHPFSLAACSFEHAAVAARGLESALMRALNGLDGELGIFALLEPWQRDEAKLYGVDDECKSILDATFQAFVRLFTNAHPAESGHMHTYLTVARDMVSSRVRVYLMAARHAQLQFRSQLLFEGEELSERQFLAAAEEADSALRGMLDALRHLEESRNSYAYSKEELEKAKDKNNKDANKDILMTATAAANAASGTLRAATRGVAEREKRAWRSWERGAPGRVLRGTMR